MAVLLILIILILVICGILINQRMKQAEAFDLGPNTELTTCPLKSTAYLAKNGDTLCCDGPLGADGKCGKPLCALAQRKDMLSCKAMLDAENKISAKFCPPSLTNYYTDANKKSGCTDGALNNDRTGPISPFAKVCKIYDDNITVKINGKQTKFTNNDIQPDSCAVQRRLEMDIKDMDALFGKTPHSVSQVQDSGPGSPYINLVNFTIPGDTFPNRCLTKENLINVFTKKNFPEAYIILAKKGQYNQDCMVQKALYIDKSITQEQVRQNYKAVGL